MNTATKLEFRVPAEWQLIVCDADALDPEKQDSVWYSTGYGDYRILELTNGTDTYYIYAVGDVRISHKDKDYRARSYDQLIEWGITPDTQLREALDNELIEFDNNNWFETVDYCSGEWSEFSGGDLQEMIDYTINEFHPWIQENK